MAITQFDVGEVASWCAGLIASWISAAAGWCSHARPTSAFEELGQLHYLPGAIVVLLLMLSLWLAAGVYVAVGADRRRGFGCGVWSLLPGAALISISKFDLPNGCDWVVAGLWCLMLLILLGCSVFGALRMPEVSIARKVVAAVAAVFWCLIMAAAGVVLCQVAWDCPAVLVIAIPFLACICSTCGGDFSHFLFSSKIWMTVRMVCSLVWVAYVASVVINLRAGDTSTQSMFEFLLSTGFAGLLQSGFLWAVWGASVNEAANTEHYVAWYDRFGNLIKRERDPGEDAMGCLMSIVVGLLMIAFLSAFLGPIVFVVNCVQFADVWTRGTRVHILSVTVAVLMSVIVLCEVPMVWRYVSARTDEISRQVKAENNAKRQLQMPTPIQYNQPKYNQPNRGRIWRRGAR